MIFITLPSMKTCCFNINTNEPLNLYLFDIKDKFDIHYLVFNILYRNKIIDLSKTIKDYGIKSDDTLVLKITSIKDDYNR
jgi:hypothetical protein